MRIYAHQQIQAHGHPQCLQHSANSTVPMAQSLQHKFYSTVLLALCLSHSAYSTVLISQCLQHSGYSTVQIAQLFFSQFARIQPTIQHSQGKKQHGCVLIQRLVLEPLLYTLKLAKFRVSIVNACVLCVVCAYILPVAIFLFLLLICCLCLLFDVYVLICCLSLCNLSERSVSQIDTLRGNQPSFCSKMFNCISFWEIFEQYFFLDTENLVCDRNLGAALCQKFPCSTQVLDATSIRTPHKSLCRGLAIDLRPNEASQIQIREKNPWFCTKEWKRNRLMLGELVGEHYPKHLHP